VSTHRKLRSFVRIANHILSFAGLSALVSIAACDAPEPDSPAAPAGATAQIANTQEDWHAAMKQLALPARGCFTSDFPRIEWKQVPCATPPDRPYPPGRHPLTVGGGPTDFSARPAGLISGAEGSFTSVSGVTSINSVPSGGISAFSLQLNTKPFTTPACGASPNPGCLGWQQFVYSNTGSAFIQYWLLKYNTTCPAGWNTFSFSGSTDIYCWKNGAGSVTVGAQPISNLINLSLIGSASLGGLDTIAMKTGATTMSATNSDSILTLASGWTDAEFNIFGDCCGSDATFNAGSSVTVQTIVHNGTMNAPACVMEGFTGETNSLTLVGTPAILGSLPSPGIRFNMTNVTPFSAASCANATGVGDPHLTTVRGLYYDFQASGDFLLAQSGPDFVVQTRQASGAPTWPNAAVNKAVATRMGKTSVAVCLAPTRLEINGESAVLEDGKQVDLPDGVSLARHGDVYLVVGPQGDSVRAQLHSSYIDVAVGFGRWPTPVQGLLGNGRTASEIVTRDGAVLREPVSFQDRYFKFGDSWRVPASESLLCSDKQVELRNPDKPFCVTDLDPKAREHAQAVCQQFDIKQGPMLDACVLDVAMLGDDKAAQAFVNAPFPVVIGANGCR
jgi:hypothetical protein